MKVKTADLIGPALDWAVAVVEGLTEENAWTTVEIFKAIRAGGGYWYSTNWAQGGPIIEREGVEINVRNWSASPGCRLPGKYEWSARLCFVRQTECKHFGPTPLIAAMRCVVASRLGYEVDVPDELV